jgi:hypothetical protein
MLYFSLLINTSLNNTKIPEVITAKCFHKCHNNKQFIPRVYMFINHKMTHRYIYSRFTRHALQLHHVTWALEEVDPAGLHRQSGNKLEAIIYYSKPQPAQHCLTQVT